MPDRNTCVRKVTPTRAGDGFALASRNETHEKGRLVVEVLRNWAPPGAARCRRDERLGGWMDDRAGTMQDIAQMSFEDALAELEAIVRRLEEGAAKLDDAIGAYERGAALKRHCEAKLGEAQARVDKIVLGANGRVAAETIAID